MDLENQLLAEDSWESYLKQLGSLDLTLLECLPEFMVISPGKTGTTWLSKNLNCHPEMFIPEVKEVRYFCTQWRSHDINWYLKHFQEGMNLVKGDISPSYALLPSRNIKLIRLLMPNLKLVFLMRDPINRAWSQTKHNHRYCECAFSFYKGDFKSVSDRKFVESFVHKRPFFLGDYLGTLKRWLSFFPKEQFFIGFYETIKDDPQSLLINIFDHLGVKSGVNWSVFPISEIFLKGMEGETPDNLRKYLRSIYRTRTEELITFLREQFNITNIPSEWENTLVGEEISDPFILEEDYKGYNTFLYKGNFYALPQSMGYFGITAENIKEHQESGKCFAGNSLFEVKYLVDKSLCQALQKEGYNYRIYSEMDFEDYCLTNVLNEILEYLCRVKE